MLRDAITPLLEAARTERGEARQLAADSQATAWQLRESARELQVALKQLRRVLRSRFGTSHVDYQRLRAFRVRGDVEPVEVEEEGIAPELAAPSEAANDTASPDAADRDGDSATFPVPVPEADVA